MNTGTEREEGNWRRTGVSECERRRGVRQTLIWSQTAGLGQANPSSAIQYITDNIHRRSTHSFSHTHKCHHPPKQSLFLSDAEHQSVIFCATVTYTSLMNNA